MESAVLHVSDFNGHVVWCGITSVKAQQLFKPYLERADTRYNKSNNCYM